MLLKTNISLIFFLTIFLTNEIKTLGLSTSFKIVPNQEKFELTSNGFVSKKVQTFMSSNKQKSLSLNDKSTKNKKASSDMKNFPMNKKIKAMNYRQINLTPLNKQNNGLVKIRNNALIQIPTLIKKRSSILKNNVITIKSHANQNNKKAKANDIFKDFTNKKAQNNQESKVIELSLIHI